MFINSIIWEMIRPLLGKQNCRKQVGQRSLSLGFGRKIVHSKPRLRDNFYGEWEIGTYNSAWRVIKNGEIVCASSDLTDSVGDMDRSIQEIDLGSIVDIQQLNGIDVRLSFNNNIIIDFLPTTSEEDEVFHIFCPQHKYIEFAIRKGWTVGESNAPWPK